MHASLTREAAKALNATFSVSLFRGGTPVGTVAIKALPADIAVTGGATSLALDPGTAAALTSLGVSVSPIGPATAGDDGALRFPITGGDAAAGGADRDDLPQRRDRVLLGARARRAAQVRHHAR